MFEQDIEARFAIEAKNKFAPILAKYDAQSKEKEVSVAFAFSGIQSTVSEQIQTLITSMLETACQQGIEAKYIQARFCFYSKEQWEKDTKEVLKNVVLPAAKIRIEKADSVIDIVIENSDSLALLLKVARLAISKILGVLWLEQKGFPNLNILHSQEQTIDINAIEKLAFIYVSQNFSTTLQKKSHSETESFLLSESKELYADPTRAQQSWLEQEWQLVTANLRENQETLLEKTAAKSLVLASNLGIILPHEKQKIKEVSSNIVSFFSVIKEKAKLLFSIMEEIEQAYRLLLDSSVSYDTDLIEKYTFIVRQRRNMFLEHNYAHLFFCQFLDEEPKEDFTFWLLRNKVISLKTGTQKLVSQYKESYQNNLYQKLFDLLEGLLQYKANPKKERASLLQKHLYWLDFRKPMIRLFADGCDVGMNLSKMRNETKPWQEEASTVKRILSQGWGYFISFVLLNQYLSLQGNPKQAKKLQIAVQQYQESQIKKPVYTLSYFFTCMYFFQTENLGACIQVMQEGSVALDFLLENHNLLKEKKDFITLVQDYAKIQVASENLK